MVNGFLEDQGGFGDALSNIGANIGRGLIGVSTLGLSELAIQNKRRQQQEQQAAAEQQALQQKALLQQTGQIASGQAPQFQTPEFQGLPVQQQQRQRAGALLALPTKQAQTLGAELFKTATTTPERTLATRKQTEVERKNQASERDRNRELALDEKRLNSDLQKAISDSASGRIDKTTFDQAGKLRAELNRKSERFRLASESWDTISATGEGVNPINDVAMIIAFMKIQDPGSVVREAEADTVRRAAGRTDRLGAMAKRVLDGELLTKKQRNEILTLSRNTFRKRVKEQIRVEGQTEKLAKNFGVGIEFINPTPSTFEQFGLKPDTPPPPGDQGAIAGLSPQAGGQAAPAGIDAGLAAQLLQSRGF